MSSSSHAKVVTSRFIIIFPLDTGRKLSVLCTFTLRLVPRGFKPCKGLKNKESTSRLRQNYLWGPEPTRNGIKITKGIKI